MSRKLQKSPPSPGTGKMHLFWNSAHAYSKGYPMMPFDRFQPSPPVLMAGLTLAAVAVRRKSIIYPGYHERCETFSEGNNLTRTVLFFIVRHAGMKLPT